MHAPATPTFSATTVHTMLSRGVWALPVYAVLLGLSTLTQQPDYATDFEAYAAYVTTNTFLVSHLVASIAGAAVGIVGVVSLAAVLIGSGARSGRILIGAVLSIAGNVANTALFGVAAFAQPAIGRAYRAGEEYAVALNADVYGPELIATAVTGLALFIAGAVLLGTATARVDGLRASGITYAASLTIFVVANFTIPILQPVMAAALTIATLAMARRLNQGGS
ncbi:hypothetical protein EV643_114249 [Kribbella sp. VKM Ac-2527]|uniref:DUF4386 family protein n=1 Tax=Kribbella caucasensis TaxID=2512215 RepID=A0A4V3C9E4_9ACTN|nr:hypothetical protein [Kribbella sp. VKM Ac-2527]TDO45104.1 hypothetical protein EV643_114249 [Kribbella sp. VKM Ac-2527]